MIDTFSAIPVGEKHVVPSAGPNLGELLSAEMAGRVTYALASDRVELLRQVEEEHRGAAEALRACLRQSGSEVPAHAASLGVWAAAARAAVAGELPMLLKSLHEAEQAVFQTYEASLPVLDPASARVVQHKLIPAQSRRVRLLTQLLTGVQSTSGSGA
jgi:hypothetical protein